MRVSLIVAVAKNRVIGNDGTLPWRFSSDLKKFKAITTGKAVIMGRKTWDSLPRKPLPGRLNIVVTRSAGFEAQGASVATSVEAALSLAAGQDEVMVIGGAEIYKAFLPKADRIYMTELDRAITGDTTFGELDPDQWGETGRETLPASPADTVGGDFVTYDRRKPVYPAADKGS
jgi:dihydrofolate reductase